MGSPFNCCVQFIASCHAAAILAIAIISPSEVSLNPLAIRLCYQLCIPQLSEALASYHAATPVANGHDAFHRHSFLPQATDHVLGSIQFLQDGCAPLYGASIHGHKDIAQLLLNHGAGVNTARKVRAHALELHSHTLRSIDFGMHRPAVCLRL